MFCNLSVRYRLLPVFAIISALMVTAIGVTHAQGDTMAKVRVIHASPDAPAVDILINGERAIEGLEYQSGTDYVDLAAGDYELQVVPAGGEAGDAVIDALTTFDSGTWYSVVAIGTLDSIEPLIVVDEISEPEAGMAHIKVVHASSDAPAVDVAVAGGPILFEDAPYTAATEYLPVEAGTYDLEVRPTGTEEVALEIPGFVLEAGVVYSAYAMGLLSDGSLTVVPFVDSTFEQMAEADATPTETGAASTEIEATATEAAAEPTAGTGDGAVPSMPDTGAGGLADDNDSSMPWFIGAASLALLAAGGVLIARSRRTA